MTESTVEPMSVPEIEELIGAYALDAVDVDEREIVEAHLADCPRCRAELADHREVAALLAQTGSTAPEEVWERIAASLEEPPPALRLEVVAPAEPTDRDVIPLGSRRRSGARVLTAVVAVAAIVIAVLGVVVVRQNQRIDTVTQDLAQLDVSRAAGQVMADPASHHMTLTAPDGSGDLVATAVMSPDGTGFLMTPDLPPVPSDRTYQLWGVVDGRTISLGVLGNDPSVSVFQVDTAAPISALAVTEEVTGGVTSSQAPPMLLGAA